ncbi:TonB-dependent siderophore receptor [Pseudomonas aeruginosa]|uniref:TonB-dependent siderophore receptor n=1 Tax=Pseudomonas aeruginosa TaxID=287 RepID=UPI00066BB8EA|nr:TonB-dependent siderophore receptor [Pseudomonas aeruginosa]
MRNTLTLHPRLSTAALAMALLAPIASQAEAQKIQFDIGAQSLPSALRQFGQQSQLQVLYSADEVQGLRSNAVRGQLPRYRRQLQPARLQRYHQRSADSVDLGDITVTSQESAWGHVNGYVAKRSGTGTKTDTPLKEIPQTINVVTQDEIKARGSQTVTEALRYTPGITGGGFADRVKIFDEPTSRGFSPAPMYLDGLHMPYGGGSTGGALQIDPYTLERIEVLKGPASVLFGQNQPGGIVNMVSKRPTAEPIHEVVLGGGSQDRRYGAFDVAGALDEQGTYLYRITGVGRDINSEIDYAEQKRFMLAPSFTWNPNEQTSLTFYGQYQKDNDVPEAQGLPAYGTVFSTPNGRIKRSTFIGEPGLNSYDRDQFVVGYEFSHEFNDVWTFKQNTRYAYVDDQYVAPLHGYRFVPNPNTGANDQRYTTRYGVDWSQTNKVFGMDNILQAKYKTADIEHTSLIGLDYYHSNSKFLGLYSYEAASPIIDLYKPVYGKPFTFGSPYRWDRTIRQTGVYLQDQMKWNQWFLTLGGRYDWAETDSKETAGHSNAKDEKFSGRAGFGYEFSNGITPYVSYSESFQPVSGYNLDQNSKAFKPTTGKQYEAGIKYQPPGQDSFIQASVYQIDQKNVLTTNLENPNFYNQSAAMRSKGFELEGKASLTNNLGIIASFSRNDVKYTKDNDGREGRHPAGTPPMTAAVWLDYTLGGDTVLAGLGAGIGARYTRGSDGTDTADNHFTIPSYTLYDGKLSYDFEKSPLRLKGLKLQVNLENIEDKKYVSRCAGIWDCYYGQGRTITSDLTYNW